MEFWFFQKFSIPGIDFGHFKDIVSVHSNDQSYFSVGIIQHIAKKDYPINAFLMTFKKSKGLPYLSRYTFCYKEKEITLRLTEKSLRFKHTDLGQTSDIHSFIENVFTNWIDFHHNDNKGYSDLSKYIDGREQ